MPLHARQFFLQHLALPYEGGAVIGSSYYAAPNPGSPLRMRIDFQPTIIEREYDGLRLRVIHTDRGALDTTVLSFGDHGTFTDRDASREAVGFGRDSNDRFRDWHNGGRPPWHGAHTEGLTYAIEQYVQLWFPPPASSARSPLEAPARAMSQQPPAPPGEKSSRRTR